MKRTVTITAVITVTLLVGLLLLTIRSTLEDRRDTARLLRKQKTATRMEAQRAAKHRRESERQLKIILRCIRTGNCELVEEVVEQRESSSGGGTTAPRGTEPQPPSRPSRQPPPPRPKPRPSPTRPSPEPTCISAVVEVCI